MNKQEKIELSCAICQRTFLRLKTFHNANLKRGRKTFCCSKICREKNSSLDAIERGKQTFIKRLNSRIDKTPGLGPDGNCWEWTGTKANGGYGKISKNGKIIKVHRYFWEFYNNQTIPDGLIICHHCDNPPCVNPGHLFLGTHQDNVDDMMQKGRNNQQNGENRFCAKLKEFEVRTIRKAYATGAWTMQELADFYFVTKTTVVYIIKRKTWKHI